jgi:two-component system phosphate regulon sensor histidine kinase PhoR
MIWPSSLFARHLATSLAGIAVLTAAALTTLPSQLRRQLEQAQIDRLRTTAWLVPLPHADTADPQAVRDLERTLAPFAARTGMHLRVTDAQGLQLADSPPAPSQPSRPSGDDRSVRLGHRPEFVAARRTGEGQRVARDASLGRDVRHVVVRRDATALPGHSSDVRYVWAAEDTEAIEQAVWHMQSTLLTGAGIVTLWALLSARFQRRGLSELLASLEEATRAIARGAPISRLPTLRSEELRPLGTTLERVASEVRSRESRLREALDRIDTVLSGMLEGVIAVDRDETILLANAAAGRLLGFDHSQAERYTLLELARVHKLRKVVQTVLAQRNPARAEIAWQGPPARELEVHAMPLPGDPCSGVILVIDDITQLRRLEGVRQQFLANVSHELKTPLSSIKAYTETLLGGAAEDPQHCQRFLQRISEQAERLDVLIRDMLSLAQIESGQVTLELGAVSLASVARRCLADYEPVAAAKQIELRCEFESPGPTLHADVEATREILANLIDNAIKYTPGQGSVTVHCQTDGGFAQLAVKDTGPGIPAEHLERLFERFYRVDRARSRELGGTGLGLSIVKHLTQAMGGTVQVASTIGQGSVFTVRLPLAKGTDDQPPSR